MKTIRQPSIRPHATEKYTWQLRKGVKFEYSGREDESEIIINSGRVKSGVTLGVSELYQMAVFCGLSEYAPKLQGRLSREMEPYKYTRPSDQVKWYEHNGGKGEGYTKLEITENEIIEIKNKWGVNPSDKVTLHLADVVALLGFLQQNPSDQLRAKWQNDWSKAHEAPAIE